jgi:hypothetical protein
MKASAPDESLALETISVQPLDATVLPAPDASASSESTLDQYMAATDDPNDPQMRTKRCSLGPSLVSAMDSSLDEEVRTMIKEQMKADGCG